MHRVESILENYKESSEKYNLILQKSTGRKCITTGELRESNQNRESPGDTGNIDKSVLCNL